MVVPGRPPIRRFHDRVAESRIQRRHPIHGHQPFRPLPAPTGRYPYHLDLADVVASDVLDATKNRLIFHLAGDTGGVKDVHPQRAVAGAMVTDYNAGGHPAFFYHLGDVVYFFGEAVEYFPQFYEPYADYPSAIFAIPGNHDGDLSPAMEASHTASLAAFVDNFCQRIPHHTRDALDAQRSGMTQPNVYWTLDTPLATFIGLYTNVPDGGRLDEDQITWLAEEFQHADRAKALFVAMHHPIYSFDSHHSGGAYMEQILGEATAHAGREPDMVFSGHVHNYQRFTRTLDVGGQPRDIPYIVAGAGGYHNLHTVSAGPLPFTDNAAPDVRLERFCDDRYGFLRLEITPATIAGRYLAVAAAGGDAEEKDAFTLDRASHRILP
jgi:hypothetical protein